MATLLESVQNVRASAAASNVLTEDTSNLVAAFCDVLIAAVTAILNLIVGINGILTEIVDQAVGVMVSIVLAVLDSMERVLLAVTDVVEAITSTVALSNDESSSTVGQTSSVFTKLQNLLRAGLLYSSIFDDSEYLLTQTNVEAPGLRQTLVMTKLDMVDVDYKVRAFLAVAENVSAGSEMVVRAAAVTEVLNLVFTVVVSFVQITGSILTNVLGLLFATVNGIMNLGIFVTASILSFMQSTVTAIVSSIQSILSITTAQASNNKMEADAAAPSLPDEFVFFLSESRDSLTGIMASFQNIVSQLKTVEVEAVQNQTVFQVLDLVFTVIEATVGAAVFVISGILGVASNLASDTVTLIQAMVDSIFGIVSAIITFILSVLVSLLGIFSDETFDADSAYDEVTCQLTMLTCETGNLDVAVSEVEMEVAL
jgi:phage-related protein